MAFTQGKPNIFHTIKCMGIVLVVLAHYVTAATPEYWMSIRSGFRPFLMPVFFMVSGYLLSYTLRRRRSAGKVELLKKKAARFLLPYFSIATIFFVAKFASGFFFDLKHPISLDAVIKLLINPFQSFMPILWFIYALFVMVFITILVQDKVRISVLLLIVTAFYLFNPFTTFLFCLDKIARHFPYFTLGLLCASLFDLEDEARKYRKFVVLTLAVYLLLVRFYVAPTAVLSERFVNLLVGFSGLSSFVFLGSYVHEYVNSKIIHRIGLSTMSIYLFHPMFESSVRIAWNQVLGLGQFYWPGALLAAACGLFFPIVLEQRVIMQSNTAAWLLLGAKRKKE